MVVKINEYHLNKNKQRLFILYFLNKRVSPPLPDRDSNGARKVGKLYSGVGGGGRLQSTLMIRECVYGEAKDWLARCRASE